MADGGELRVALSQLCSDLLAPSVSRNDQRDIVHSLTGLIEQFPLAKKSLGRLLSSQQPPPANSSVDTRPTAERVFRPLLAELASRCLYDCVTSQSTIALLAALAHDNSINQRRIVRWVPGVRLAANSLTADSRDSKVTKKAKRNDLYVLTVPESIKATYRKWRKRQRNLLAKASAGGYGRIPTGTPPSKNGVPMPCYCDDCLGAEQLLSTWCRHFDDLTRWTADLNGTTGDNSAGDTGADQPRSVLSASDFFRMELMDYQVLSCHCISGQVQASENIQQPVDNRHAARVYYFIPRDQATSTVEFDPVHHLSAIQIPSDVFDMVDQTRQPLSPSPQKTKHAEGDLPRLRSSAGGDEGEELGGLDEVVLFDGRYATKLCTCREATGQEESLITRTESSSPREEVTGGEGTIASVLKAIRTQCGDPKEISCVDLLGKVVEADSSPGMIDESARVVLPLVLAFFTDEEMISFEALEGVFGRYGNQLSSEVPADTVGGEVATVGDAVNTDGRLVAEHIDAQVTVSAHISTQKLRIEFVIDGEDPTFASRAVYAADLPRSSVSDAVAVPDTHLALLSLSDGDLQSILSRCYVCRSVPHHNDDDGGNIVGGSPTCLRLNCVIGSDSENSSSMFHQATETKVAPEQDADAHPSAKKTSDQKPPRPLPGLPEETKSALTRVLDTIEGDGYRLGGSDALASLVQQLSSAIASCNTRISQLSTARKGVADNARLAATSRCCACRDELIQVCKRIKLVRDEQTETTATAAGGAHGLLTSRKRQSRVRSAIQAGLRSVLARSESFDAWETPDERVLKLHLDRSVWVSGVPDFEFFQESDARVAENERKQRELSRKLQQQRRRGNGG